MLLYRLSRIAAASVSALTLDLKTEMQYSSVYVLTRGLGPELEGHTPLPLCRSFCLLMVVRLPTKTYRDCKECKLA